VELSNVKHLDQLVTYVARLERRVRELEQAADQDRPDDRERPAAPKKATKAAPYKSTD
jgi:hypothetical protein